MRPTIAFPTTPRPTTPQGSMARPTVVIIGGGFAGLGTAWSLRRSLGHEVEIVVLEARARLGGRVHSLPFGGEAGCEPPFFHHGPLLDMAEALGLAVHSYQGSKLDIGYLIDGRLVPSADWPDFARTRFPAPYDRMSPFRAWFPLASRYRAPSGWADDPLAALSRVDPALCTMSVADLLDREGFPAALVPFVSSLFHVFESPRRISALSALMRGWSARPNGTFYYLDGTLDRLIQAAAEIPDTLHLDRRVTSVHMTPDGRHRVADHHGQAWLADHVVFAIPAWNALQIDIRPGWPLPLRNALDACDYGPVIKVFARAGRDPLGDDRPPVLLADRGFNGCFPVYDLQTRQTPTSGPDRWGVEIVFVGDRARGLVARAVRGHSIADEAIATLAAAHPSLGSSLQPAHTAVWRASTGPGALPYFRPSAQIPSFFAALQRWDHGRHLVGDHTEARYAGWDGAIASGLRAARAITESLAGRPTRRPVATTT
ncbi:MAG: NAD(P)/FAD-dependent oxidoreductase [Myxococcota bacterium]